MHKVLRQTNEGWEVWPSAKMKIPGYFLGYHLAERAYDLYLGKSAQKKRDKKKDK